MVQSFVVLSGVLAALLTSGAGCGIVGYDALSADAQEESERPIQWLTFGENASDDHKQVTEDTWLDPFNPTVNYGETGYLDSISYNSILIR